MIQRMDHVGIVVDDLAAATGFFVELGLELLGEEPVEGSWVDRVVGLRSVKMPVGVLPRGQIPLGGGGPYGGPPPPSIGRIPAPPQVSRESGQDQHLGPGYYDLILNDYLTRD